MVLTVEMFGEVVSEIVGTFSPMNVDLTLVNSILNPVETHVNRIFELHIFFGGTSGTGAVRTLISGGRASPALPPPDPLASRLVTRPAPQPANSSRSDAAIARASGMRRRDRAMVVFILPRAAARGRGRVSTPAPAPWRRRLLRRRWTGRIAALRTAAACSPCPRGSTRRPARDICFACSRHSDSNTRAVRWRSRCPPI